MFLRGVSTAVLSVLLAVVPLQAASAGTVTNPGFESGLTGWAAAAGTTATVVSVGAHGGQNAAAISRTKASGSAALTDSPDQFTSIAAGTTCTATAWVRGPVGSKATVKWFARNATGGVVATKTATVSFNGSWQALPVATLTMPSTATTADLHFFAPSFALGKTWYLDDVSAACGSAPPPDPGPAPGLAGHWTLDEVSGTTAVDSSGHGNHGTGYNTVGTGRGYVFNGTNARVVVPDAPALDPGTANFSFGVTVQMAAPPLVGETFDVLRKGITTTAGGNYKLEIVHSNGLAIPRCVIKDGLRVVAAVRGPVATVATGRPHTVTCRRVGNSVTIQVDGLAPKSTTVAQLGSISNASELGIGAKPEGVTSTGFDWYLGEIHDAFVRID